MGTSQKTGQSDASDFRCIRSWPRRGGRYAHFVLAVRAQGNAGRIPANLYLAALPFLGRPLTYETLQAFDFKGSARSRKTYPLWNTTRAGF
jgi:hypothetical protein